MSTYKNRHLPTPPDPGLRPGGIRMRALHALGAVERTHAQMRWREERRQCKDAERFAKLRLERELEMEAVAA